METKTGDRRESSCNVLANHFKGNVAFQQIPTSNPEKSEEAKLEIDDKNEDSPVTHRKTSFIETLMHQLKASVGPITFTLGEAFKNAGLLLGLLLLIIFGLITVHSQHILLNCNEEIRRRHAGSLNNCQPDYAVTVELCFANGPPKLRRYSVFMRKLSNVLICMSQLGVCCVLFVFLSTNVQEVMKIWGFEMKLSILMTIVFVPTMLVSWIRNLKLLVPFTSLANLLVAASYVGTIYILLRDLPAVSERRYVADWSTLPLFFGTALYLFDTTATVIPLKNGMKKSYNFDKSFGVLNIVVFIAGSMSLVMGFLSYLKYGDDIRSSVTLNLEPKSDVLPQIIKIAICLSIVMSSALQFYFAAVIVWPKVEQTFGPFSHPVAMEILVRSLLYLCILVLAEAIPHLGLFMSLVGAVNSAAIAFIFPSMIEILIRWKNIDKFTIVKDVLMMLVGIFACVTGTFVSLWQIIRTFNII